MTPPLQARKAFLDALAVGETEPAGEPRGYGYNILCGSTPASPHTFASYAWFPKWAGWHNSHAAGRYQFEPATWADTAARLGLPDFTPASQDAAAWDLAMRVYHSRAKRNLSNDLVAGKLGWVVSALHGTWPSLTSTFPSRYQHALETP
jgi:muramidase (phage lysozyme)